MIEIDQWKLRVPSMSDAQAGRLARRVVALLSERVAPDHEDWAVEQLAVEVNWPAGESLEQLARRIAQAIVDDLVAKGALS